MRKKLNFENLLTTDLQRLIYKTLNAKRPLVEKEVYLALENKYPNRSSIVGAMYTMHQRGIIVRDYASDAKNKKLKITRPFTYAYVKNV